MAAIKLRDQTIEVEESREEIVKQISQTEGWINVTETGVENWINDRKLTININHIVMIVE